MCFQTAHALEEILVTAQKREQSLQEIPVSVSAYTQEALDRGGAWTIERLDLTTPNMNIAYWSSDVRVSLRGTVSTIIEVNGDSPVGIYLDGAFLSRTGQGFVSLLDVERVEVLRGPQGTLFGRNSTAGAVNIVTKAPSDEFEGWGEFTAGDYDHLSFRGAVNVPFSDTVQLRVAGLIEDRDGYVDNTFVPEYDLYDEDQEYIRASLRLAPTEDIEILLRGSTWQQGGRGVGFGGYKILGENRIITTPFFTLGCPCPDNLPQDPYKIAQDVPQFREVDSNFFSAQISWDVGDFATLRLITAYTDFYLARGGESDFSPLDSQLVSIAQDVETITQEVQLLSQETSPLEWLVGFYYLDEEADELFEFTFPSFFGNRLDNPDLVRPGLQETKSYAVYGQASYDISEAVRITAGGRWTKDEKGYSQNFILFGGVLPPGVVDFDGSWDEFTWKAAIDYAVSDDNLLYFSASSGFKSGLFNRFTALPNVEVDPETVIEYEVGSKNRFLDDRLQLNIAAFYNDISDFHVNRFSNALNSSYADNAGAAETWGVEIEAVATPTDQLSLSGTLSWLDATYTRYDTFHNPFVASPDFDPLGNPPGSTPIDVSGNYREHAPKWKLSLQASYDIPLGTLGIVTPLVQFAYVDDYFTTALNSALDHQESYTKTDLRLLWESANNQFYGEAFVQNIEDEGVLAASVYAQESLWATYKPPRTWGVRIGARF